MHWLAPGMASLLALAIIVIGTQWLVSPRAAARIFGLPLPEPGANIAWWLRLKGVRDIVAGMLVLAMMPWGSAHDVGLVLLVAAIIPTGDMLLILAAKGKTSSALGVHGATAAVMAVVAFLILTGGY
jgi:uncharacterized membrane protein